MCQVGWANVTAHGNDLHEKMLLVCESRINERIMLVFNFNINKTRIVRHHTLAEMNHGKSLFEFNLSLKAFVCKEAISKSSI